MKRHEYLIERSDLQGATHLQVTVSYTIGGRNYVSGGVTPRGFYVSVIPVTKRGSVISYIAFTGYNQLIMTAARFSEKQFNTAIEKSKVLIPAMIEQVLSENKKAS